MTNHISNVSDDQLAKLLATEDITIEYTPKIHTAMFDTNNRVLMLPIWTNISRELNHMLRVHETGHAIDTPVDTFDRGRPRGGFIGAIEDITKEIYKTGYGDRQKLAVKHALNVVEDVRIDKRQKRRYPGSRRDYRIGTSELWKRDFFGLQKMNTKIDDLGIIDRINLYYKGGDVEAQIPFSDEEKEFMQRLDNIERWEETLDMTKELLIMAIKEAKQNNLQPQEGDEDDGGEGEGEGEKKQKVKIKVKRSQLGKSTKGGGQSGQSSGDANVEIEIEEDMDGSGSGQGDGEDGDQEADGEGQGGGQGEDADGDQEADGEGEGEGNEKSDKPNKEGKARPGGKEGGKSDGEIVIDLRDVPIAKTLENLEAVLASLIDPNAVGSFYGTLPEANLDMIIDDFPVVLKSHRDYYLKHYSGHDKDLVFKKMRNAVISWRKAESPTVNYMVKEFEMRKAADMYSKIRQSKTGVLNMNKVHSFAYSEDIFKRNSILPEGKNHGFVMFVDCSGSMTPQMVETMKQIMALTMFCKRVQIPFEVYLFRDGGNNCWELDQSKKMAAPSNFKLRNIFSSRMSAGQMEEAMMYFMNFTKINGGPDPLGGTPLNEALIAANQVVVEFQKRTKVQIVNTIVLTDGYSNGLSFFNLNGYYQKYVIRNDKTKKNYETKKSNYPHLELTSTLVRYLKGTTGCTTIGMFISDTANYHNVEQWIPSDASEHTKKLAQDSWNKHNFAPIIGGGGYDEYFVLKPMQTFANKNSKFQSGSTSNTQIANDFSSFMKTKTVNKVLLNRFISLIVAERKKEKGSK